MALPKQSTAAAGPLPAPAVRLAVHPAATRFVIAVLTLLLAILGLVGSGQIFHRAYLGMTHQNLTVRRVEVGGPADRAGIRPGDRIVRVDNLATDAGIEERLELRGATAGQHLALEIERPGTRGRIRTTLEVVAPPLSEVVFRFTMGATGLCALGLGFFIAYRRPEKLTLVFFGMCYCIGMFLREHPHLVTPAARYLHELVYSLAQAMFPAFIVHFFLLFPFESARRRRFERWVYVPSLGLFLAQIFHLLPADPEAKRLIQNAYNVLSPLHFLAYSATAVTLFVRSFRKTRDTALKARLRLVVWATVIALVPLLATIVLAMIWPGLNVPGARYSIIALALIPMSFAYAAFRHRVFDIEILVKRSVVYTVLTALLLALYFGVVAGLGGLLHRLTGASNPLLTLVSIVVIAIAAAPVRARLQRWVDRAFFRDRYDARETLRKFSHDVSRMFELGGVAALLVERVAKLLEVDDVTLLLRDAESQPFRMRTSIPARNGTSPDLSDDVATVIGPESRPLRVEDPIDSTLVEQLPLDDRRSLVAYRTAVLLPLRSRDTLLGVLLLGHRRGVGWNNDEDLEILETLGEQAAIAIQNSMLHAERLEKERMARELAVAQSIQTHLLPTADPITDSIELSGSTVACHEIGGDFYDYIELDEDHLGIAIGDVAGKGIPAALLMSGLLSCFRSEAERGQGPSRVLASLNRRVRNIGSESHPFACFFYGIVDLRTRQLVYANGGLDPPVLVRYSGKVERLRRGGPMLGLIAGADFQEGIVSLSAGDTLVLFTDGLIEPIENKTGLNDQDLVRFLVAHRRSPTEALRERILARQTRIAGAAPDDDTTFIVARAR